MYMILEELRSSVRNRLSKTFYILKSCGGCKRRKVQALVWCTYATRFGFTAVRVTVGAVLIYVSPV